jgi:long-chain acyl-CoA synthetase
MFVQVFVSGYANVRETGENAFPLWIINFMSVKSNGAETLPQVFQGVVAQFGDKAVIKHRIGKEWHEISYKELAERIAKIAAGLASLGIEKGDRVALLSENRPEWVISDLAVLHLGAMIAPIYPTLPSPQVGYITRNSEAKAIIVENAKQLAKVVEARESLPDLKFVIIMDPDKIPEGSEVITLDDVRKKGEENPLGDKYAETWQNIDPESVASLVYTSGTTGDPKGAMITHHNFTFNVRQSLEHFERQGEAITEKDTFLSFLPLCHVFERTTGYYLPFFVGAAVAYSEGVRTLMDDMAVNKPTIMVCVPRVYEAFVERIQAAAEKKTENEQKIFKEAIAAGEEYAEKKRTTGHAGPILWAKHVAFDKVVFKAIRERFGGEMRFFVAGGAALNPETAKFFEAIGLPVLEGYGMTESSPVIAVNPNRRVKIGTVGICLPRGEIKIAEDGEICYRGENVMKGYWKNDTATAEMIDSEGWLHTGDIGHLDDEGYLKITDRKKDIIVLGNGKNVAPQPIEQTIKNSPFISEIVLIGDKQSIVTALVVPNKEKLKEWAKGENLPADDEEALVNSPETRKKIKAEIDANSKHLADFERVKKFALLNTTFSVDGGEMTPTLKIKRKVVLQKYAKEVASLRGGEE